MTSANPVTPNTIDWGGRHGGENQSDDTVRLACPSPRGPRSSTLSGPRLESLVVATARSLVSALAIRGSRRRTLTGRRCRAESASEGSSASAEALI